MTSATSSPAEPGAPATPLKGKLAILVGLLQRPEGASVHDLAEATGWQIHSVRGAMAGALKAKGYVVASDKPADVRIYRLEPQKPKRAGRRPKAAGSAD